MKRRNIIILTAVIICAVSGFVGYDVWQERERKQAQFESANSPNCSMCSFIKKDLAEQNKMIKKELEKKNAQ